MHVVEGLEDLRSHVATLYRGVRLHRVRRFHQTHLHGVVLGTVLNHQRGVTLGDAGVVGGLDHVVACVVAVHALDRQRLQLIVAAQLMQGRGGGKEG